jgi:hypothetical protein
MGKCQTLRGFPNKKPSIKPSASPSDLSSTPTTFPSYSTVTETPSTAPSIAPTEGSSVFPSNERSVLEVALGAILPPPVKASIDMLVNSSNDRVTAYLMSNIVVSMITPNQSQMHVINSRDDMLRASECAFYHTTGDPDAALRLISIASYSSIQSVADAIAYMNLTGLGSPVTLNIVRNDINTWGSSCDYLIEKQLANTLPTARPTTTPNTSTNASAGRLIFRHTNAESENCVSALDIYFVNGMCGTTDAVAASLVTLKRYITQLPDAERINVVSFFNPSNGLLCSIDMLENIILLIEEKGGWNNKQITIFDVVRWILSVSFAPFVQISLEMLSSLYEFPWLQEAVELSAENIAKYLKDFTPVPATTAALTAKVTDSLFHGKSVILLGSSQGNLYVNSVYKELSSESLKYVQTLAVGTPALYVGKPSQFSPYVTRTDDLVISAVRIAFPALVGNTLPSIPRKVFGTGHDFIMEYMGDANIRSAIMEDLRNLIATASYPVIGGLSGPLTVTLTWGPQPDIDLHVYEPDGTHVDYRNKRGNAGYLDVDDTSSYGPENYYVSSSSLQLGSYLIGVNYYSGSGPDVAHISIRTCTSIRDYELSVYTSCGEACNNSPVMIAKVSVSRDQSGALRFDINSL